MAHEHKLEIFRGLLKFKSNTQKIWASVSYGYLFFRYEIIKLDIHYSNACKSILHSLGFYALKR